MAKRTERVAVSLDDEEIADLAILANRQHRSPSEYLYVLLLKAMYGSLGAERHLANRNRCDSLRQRVTPADQVDSRFHGGEV